MSTLPFEQRRRETTAKLAALMLANAFIFQEQLSSLDARVEPIKALLARRDFLNETATHWEMIVKTINYVPIFRVARDILLSLPANADTDLAIRNLANRSLYIVSKKAALRHDLMGRIYHLLLLEAKYLGTFYTSVPAATLLLKLALDIDKWPSIDWSEDAALKDFQIADIACGTGTLLMAASQVITDNFIKYSVVNGHNVDDAALRNLHKLIIEEMLHGYDVLPSAVHLTASTLALLAPEICFHKMRLYSLPMGRMQSGQMYLGSIDYISAATVQTQLDLMSPESNIGGAEKVSEIEARSVAPLPDLDLCVMNPPFVRSVGGNLLFGSVPDQRSEMQIELARRLRVTNLSASSTAGLGSVFAAVGDRHVKPGGRLALVLPAAITTGVAWAKTRDLIKHGYVLETLITSHDPLRWNFSENTDLSEVMFIARKRKRRETNAAMATQTTQFINLWQNPTSSAHALAVAGAITRGAAAQIGSNTRPSHGITPIISGSEKYGEMLEIPWNQLRTQPWIGGNFAQSELVRAAWFIRQGLLYSPGRQDFGRFPICTISNIATLGPDRRDIYDGFQQSQEATAYPALWGHKADEIQSMKVEPNSFLSPLSRAAAGRPLRDAAVLWGRSGRLMIAERMWLVTQRLVCVRLPGLALSNVWWPLAMKHVNVSAEKALAMWLNSTIGLLTIIGYRVPTRGPWVQFKKPLLEEMPILDLRNLSRWQLGQLGAAYDLIADSKIDVMKNMATDETRTAIDSAISRVLDLPDLSPLRALLAREPIVCGESLQPEQTKLPTKEQFQFELIS